MKRNSLKFILVFMLPILLWAFSPMVSMACSKKMVACASCCSHSSQAHLSLKTEISSPDCCVYNSSENFTAFVSVQKLDDLSQKKLFSLVTEKPLDTSSLQSVSKFNVALSQASAFLPHPPLILMKSSFLI